MHCSNVETLVEALLSRVGKRVIVGIPLGLGKPNHIVNELYRRAAQDSSISLRILTALTLARRGYRSGLEQRLVEPLNQRLFGNYPELAYAEPLARGTLPSNIEVNEFFYAPGSMLRSDSAQQSYVHLDYTSALQYGVAQGMNVFAQLVSPPPTSGPSSNNATFSMSCNSDIAVDLVPLLHQQRAAGANVAICAQLNRSLPFMPGSSELPQSDFDFVLDAPAYDFDLPSVPNQPVGTADYCIALHASALVKDGGTLQLGIGALSDAITQCLILRHQKPDLYNQAWERHPDRALIDRVGGTGAFERGLYSSTEMLVEGFIHLLKAGVLKRKAYPSAILQRALNARPARNGDNDYVDRALLDQLISANVSSATLKALGVLRGHAPDDLASIDESHLGDRLRGGVLLHGGFFLGQRSLYQALRELPEAERVSIQMVSIDYVNTLDGEHELKVSQRAHARFINSGLIATLLGAVASDGLDNGRVISGPGGQYNFVSMAQGLPDARSILLIRATHRAGRDLSSNIRGAYGHTTIPRQLRDMVITEYGIADLKYKTDGQIVEAMIQIADSRFQPELVAWAKRAGKLPGTYVVPDRFKDNLPARLDKTLGALRPHLPRLPFGSDVTDVEIDLARALGDLKTQPSASLHALRAALVLPVTAKPYLERMGLLDPSGVSEYAMARLVVYALEQAGLLSA